MEEEKNIQVEDENDDSQFQEISKIKLNKNNTKVLY